MTTEENLRNIQSATTKIRDMRNGNHVEAFTIDEYIVTLAALEVAAAVVELFKERGRR
jgi:hypothetical protein